MVHQLTAPPAPVASTDDGNTKKIKVEHPLRCTKYRFRVVAANKIGPSRPGEMKGPDILMKDPWDEPGPCCKPDILDWSPNHTVTSPGLRRLTAAPRYTRHEQKEKNMGQWVQGKVLTVKKSRPWATSSRVRLMVWSKVVSISSE